MLHARKEGTETFFLHESFMKYTEKTHWKAMEVVGGGGLGLLENWAYTFVAELFGSILNLSPDAFATVICKFVWHSQALHFINNAALNNTATLENI